jgi:hypothetical protein
LATWHFLVQSFFCIPFLLCIIYWNDMCITKVCHFRSHIFQIHFLNIRYHMKHFKTLYASIDNSYTWNKI